MDNRTRLIIMCVICAGIFLLLSKCAQNRDVDGINVVWGFLCAILYIMTGAVYKPWDVVKIYSASAAAILLGGSRLIPVIIAVMLAVHFWILIIGPVKKPADD